MGNFTCLFKEKCDSISNLGGKGFMKSYVTKHFFQENIWKGRRIQQVFIVAS